MSSEHIHRRRFRRSRNVVTSALMIVLAGCTATGGGCSPTADSSGDPTTTTVDPSTSTTEVEGSTSTTTASTTTPSTTTTSSTTTTTLEPVGTVVSIDDVSVEDCLSVVGEDAMVTSATRFGCSEPHEAEVFAQFEIAEGDLPADGSRPDGYPGGNEVTWFGQDRCQERFEGYVGEDYWVADGLDIKVVTPSFSTWDVGDRTVTCLLIASDGGLLTGSAKQA